MIFYNFTTVIPMIDNEMTREDFYLNVHSISVFAVVYSVHGDATTLIVKLYDICLL